MISNERFNQISAVAQKLGATGTPRGHGGAAARLVLQQSPWPSMAWDTPTEIMAKSIAAYVARKDPYRGRDPQIRRNRALVILKMAGDMIAAEPAFGSTSSWQAQELRGNPLAYVAWCNRAVAILELIVAGLPDYIEPCEDLDREQTLPLYATMRGARGVMGRIALLMADQRHPDSYAMERWSNLVIEGAGTQLMGKIKRTASRDDLIDAAIGMSPFRMLVDIFSGTPIADIMLRPTPVRIPERIFCEHAFVAGKTGSGKTQLIQTMVSRFFPTDAGVLVIDTKGDCTLSSRLVRHAQCRDDKIILCDFSDPEMRPEINPFKLGERTSIEAVAYILEGLGDGLSGKQSRMFNAMAAMVSRIEGANLDTFLEILSREDAIAPYMPQLMDDPATAEFLESDWLSDDISATKEQVRGRLRAIRDKEGLNGLFSGHETTFDLGAELDAGNLVIMKLPANVLGDGQSIVARFIMALAVQEIMARPHRDNMPLWLGWVDEACDLGPPGFAVPKWLSQGREKRSGLILSCQNISQLKGDIESSVLANVAVIATGRLNKEDANKVTNAIGVESKTLQNFEAVDGRYGQFALAISGLIPCGAVSRVPFGVMEHSYRRTDDRVARIYEANKARWRRASVAGLREVNLSADMPVRRRASFIGVSAED